MLSLRLLGSLLVGARGGIYTLSGETVVGSTSSGTTSVAVILINPDGTVDKNQDSVVSQIDAATDWVRPAGIGDETSFEVRYTNKVGDDLLVHNVQLEDVWHDLDSLNQWGYTTVASGPGTSHSGTFDIEIRNKATQVVLASANYDLSVTEAA